MTTIPLAATARGIGRRTGETGVGTLEAAILVALTVSCVVVPRQLIFKVAADGHYGIAPPGVGLSTFALAVWGSLAVLLASALAHRRHRTLPFWQLVFVGFAAVGLVVVWPSGGERAGGVVQLVTGVAAWVVGRWLAPSLLTKDRLVGAVCWGIFGLMGLELAVSLAQLAGLPINPMSERLTAMMGDRVNGTLSHPDGLGKLVFLTWLLALALMPLASPRHRRLLWTGVLFGMGPLVLCQGRATLIASITLLLFWAMGSQRTVKPWVRLAVPLTVLAVLAPFGSVFLERMQEDPDGGPRGQLTQSAFDQIARTPWSGTGPNAYVTVVSGYDTVVAQGYPVHNTFLLTAAELGLPGALLFWMPFLLLTAAAVGQLRSRSVVVQNAAIAFLAGLPGLMLLLLSGWGMLQWSMLPLFFLVLGLLHGILGPNYGAAARSWRATR